VQISAKISADDAVKFRRLRIMVQPAASAARLAGDPGLAANSRR